MIIKKILFILIVILPAFAFQSESFFGYNLNDLNNKKISFEGFKENKATVIIFLLADCPASQSYSLTLNKLSKKYSDKKISFIGVFPGTFSSDEEIKKFRKDFKINFPLLKDPDMVLAKGLNAKVGPSCFLINDIGTVVYKGRIDDWLFALGKKKQIVTENNLDDAIKAVLNNQPVKIFETNPIGCILEYEN